MITEGSETETRWKPVRAGSRLAALTTVLFLLVVSFVWRASTERSSTRFHQGLGDHNTPPALRPVFNSSLELEMRDGNAESVSAAALSTRSHVSNHRQLQPEQQSYSGGDLLFGMQSLDASSNSFDRHWDDAKGTRRRKYHRSNDVERNVDAARRSDLPWQVHFAASRQRERAPRVSPNPVSKKRRKKHRKGIPGAKGGGPMSRGANVAAADPRGSVSSQRNYLKRAQSPYDAQPRQTEAFQTYAELLYAVDSYFYAPLSNVEHDTFPSSGSSSEGLYDNVDSRRRRRIIERYGPIDEWDVSYITSLKDLFSYYRNSRTASNVDETVDLSRCKTPEAIEYYSCGLLPLLIEAPHILVDLVDSHF
jgi:hypothetical protein